jgi:heme exporter protein C
LWAHEAWNTWWTWEPRLTASLILWTLFAAYFLLRSNVESAERRARLCAVVAILTLADLPLVIMATRWFRGIHPVSPEMDGRMRLVLLVTVTVFSLFFGWLVMLRRQQLRSAERLSALA